MKPSTLKNCQE